MGHYACEHDDPALQAQDAYEESLAQAQAEEYYAAQDAAEQERTDDEWFASLGEEDIRCLAGPELTDADIDAMYREWCERNGIDPDEPEPDDSTALARHVARDVA
jgi:hypothetical protein